MSDLIDKLRDQRCNREPFTNGHADCICRLTNAAADEIERLRTALDGMVKYANISPAVEGVVYSCGSHAEVIKNAHQVLMRQFQ